MEILERLTKISEWAGVTPKQHEHAMGRIFAAIGRMGKESKSEDPARAGHLLNNFTKNLDDNPSLVGWGLKVAATVSDPVWDRFVDNFLVELVMRRPALVQAKKQELGFVPPMTLVLNPTMRCNLRCEGCYAWSFEKKQDMEPALFERVITEARDLGVRLITLTGGEPFLYPQLLDTFAKFNDLSFLVYTNAQCLDAPTVERLRTLGNVWPAISVEGFEAETDARRGRGVHTRLIEAMHRLRDAGVMFGISVVPTRNNSECIADDAFLDYYIQQGAQFGWMFTYLPVGRDPNPDLMATPAQRDKMLCKMLEWRRTRPFFLVDFWGDGPLCGGCMSASRFAFVTTDGWVQPCTFVHFATHNVREHSLREAFESPFFSAIRGKQPYAENLLRPCKIIDHPEVLKELIDRTGARPSYPGAEEILTNPRVRAHLACYSQEYKQLADKRWASDEYQNGHAVKVPFFGQIDLHQLYRERLENARRQEEARRQKALAVSKPSEFVNPLSVGPQESRSPWTSVIPS